MPIRRPDDGCHGYSSSRNSVLWAFSSLVVHHDQAPRLNRIQTTSTRGVRAHIRRVAGCATPTGFAGHAGATANLKLTFHLDHSAGADHKAIVKCEKNPCSLTERKEEGPNHHFWPGPKLAGLACSFASPHIAYRLKRCDIRSEASAAIEAYVLLRDDARRAARSPSG